MAYGAEYVRKSGKPNYAAAHAAHLRALERNRRESGRQLIEACKRAEALFQAQKEAREITAAIAASQPKLTKKEALVAAAKAAKVERRRQRRIAQAEAALSANEAISIARRMYALRLRDPLSGKQFVDGVDYNDDGEGNELESLDEFKARVLG
ncbi:uncharacterized protein EAE97_011474 [Botrytis byssoidea]|uniref:Uncharacterized protein n=1 Tax=Botrytis byssoidea TaxID=139641 RepID=A0A9P5LKJ2_9HELO|nr:uncharacterized protein EAE97_011474 [Botrytis byssoidea]KAF7920581.1 hypothetical protein EAE97_011474 [Botrytis byssoidea]